MYAPSVAAAASASASAAGISPNASPVSLSFSCSKLPSLDAFSKSDPFVVLYQEIGRTGNWHQVGSTEIKMNDSNPTFDRTMEMSWTFEQEQKLKVAVFDYDGPGARTHDFIGEVTTTLGYLVSGRAAGRTLQLQRPGAPPAGSVTIRTTELKGPNAKDFLEFQAKGISLAKKDLLSLSDPLFVVSRVLPDGKGGKITQKVFESEHIDNNLNPVWKKASVPLLQLCAGDLAAPLQFDVYDHNSILANTLIGSFTANVHEILASGQGGRTFEVIKQKHVGRAGYKNSGEFKFLSAEIKHTPSFLEYVLGGLEINLVFCVDCTGSNGHPLDRSSLHYMGEAGRTSNEYAQALTAVGNILLPFDSDGLPVMLGFGGILPGQSDANHCFPLSLDERYPQVPGGVEGMLTCYRSALSRVTLSGPTYFANLIRRTATSVAREGMSQERQRFTLMVILTDGAICDVEDTVNAIVEASSLPLSIVIVGVGDGGEDGFRSMDFLDADGSRLMSSTGHYAQRDVVNFVPFRKLAAFGYAAGSALAKEVLAEVPGQVVSAFMSKGIRPNAPVPPPGSFPAPVAPAPPVAPASFGPSPTGAGAVPVPLTGASAPPVTATAVAVPVPLPLPGPYPSGPGMGSPATAAAASAAASASAAAAAAGYGGAYDGYPQGSTTSAASAASLRTPTFIPSAPGFGGYPNLTAGGGSR